MPIKPVRSIHKNIRAGTQKREIYYRYTAQCWRDIYFIFYHSKNTQARIEICTRIHHTQIHLFPSYFLLPLLLLPFTPHPILPLTTHAPVTPAAATAVNVTIPVSVSVAVKVVSPTPPSPGIQTVFNSEKGM